MKLSDLQNAIDEMKGCFGDAILDSHIYLDCTFGAELMLQVGTDCITTLFILSEEGEE